MSTTAPTGTAPEPSVNRPRRRALLSVAITAALAVGAGAVAVSLTSSDATAGHQTHRAVTLATNVDAQALWDKLATLPADQFDAVVAGLTPDELAQLGAIAEGIAVAAGNH